VYCQCGWTLFPVTDCVGLGIGCHSSVNSPAALLTLIVNAGVSPLLRWAIWMAAEDPAGNVPLSPLGRVMASPSASVVYDRSGDEITLDEIEKIVI